MKVCILTFVVSQSQVSFNPEDRKQICASGKGVFKIFKLEKETLYQSNLFQMDIENILCHAWMSEDYIVAGTETGKLLLLMVHFGHVQKLESPYKR